jgi:hypothetical protein
MVNAKNIAVFVVSMMLSFPSLAQTPESAVLAPFEECVTISDSSQRLECYDAAVGRARSIADVNSAEREKQRLENFGLSALQREEREKADDSVRRGFEDDVRAVNANISNAYADSRTGYRLFVLDNGQIWQESSKGTLRRTPKDGVAVEIRRGGIGGFQLRVKDGKGFTYVKRLK